VFTLLLTLLLTLSALARADDLSTLLHQGDLVLIQSTDDGHLDQVRTWSWFPQAPATVWRTLVQYDTYSQWMPRVKQAQVLASRDGFVDVRWAIKVPGPSIDFTARYHLDPAAMRIEGEWTDGALAGSTWTWQLSAEAGGTRMERVVKTNAATDSWLLRQFDDRWHTLEYGINAATPIIEAQGLRARLQAVDPR